MSYYLTDMLRLVRNELQDTGEASYADAEVEAAIGQTLWEISDAKPYEVLETVTLTDESPFVDVSTITDLIDVVAAYYPVTSTYEYWKEKRYVTHFGNTIQIIMDARPSGDSESAYLECEKRHTLTELTSTLTPDLERILVIGASARVARSHARPSINRQNVGGGRVPTNLMAWAQLQEGKFKLQLASITKQRTTQLYSRD